MSNISVIYTPKNINQTKEKPMLNLDQFIEQRLSLSEVISAPILWGDKVYQSNAVGLEIRTEKLPNHLHLKLDLLINIDKDGNCDNDYIGSLRIPYETLAKTYSKTVEQIKNTYVDYNGDGVIEYQDEEQDVDNINKSNSKNYIKFSLFRMQDPTEWYEEVDGQECLKLDNIVLDLLNSCYGK